MKRTNFWRRKLLRRSVQFIGSRFYRNPDPDLRRSILVAGTARSGTTWLGDLIASQFACRILFEPFNPDLVPAYRNFNYFQYLRPQNENPEFQTFAERVLRGEIRHRWIDRQNEQLFPTHRLIKEIRANLALKWLHDHFADVPIILLLRHPCAVVQSRMQLNWATDGDIQHFLSQPSLVEDHLAPYMDMIHTARTPEEKHAIIWSVSNLVPLLQFKPGEVKVVYYENLCTQPEHELQDLFAGFNWPYKPASMQQLNRPSQTTVENSAIVDGSDKINFWKKKLTPAQVTNILQVVDAFGLSHLYGDSSMPLTTLLMDHSL